MRRPTLAAWALAAGPALMGLPAAHAHPHGALDCAVRVGVEQGRLAWLDQQLTLDAANTQALATRLQLDAAEPERAARLFRGVIEGLFRQSGWMLQTRAAGHPEPLALRDPEPARWSRDAEGRAVVTVRLQPADLHSPADGVQLACADPSWYWAAGFIDATQVQVSGAACRASTGQATALAEQAQAMRAAAQQGGSVGADQVQAGLLQSGTLRSGSATVHC
jgi:ABC-type uncharacterized transport system substrate-binding protein